MPPMELHISADLCSTGIEKRKWDDPECNLTIVLPSEIGLSKKLEGEFGWWQQWFNAVWELFGMEERYEILGDGFDEVGRRLAKCVADELGTSVRVLYHPQGGWCLQIGYGQTIVIQEVPPFLTA